MFKNIFKIFLTTSILFALPVSVAAAEFKAGTRFVLDTAVEDDLYVAAGQIYIDSPVQGDLIAGGGEVEVSGDVDDDIIVGGGRVLVRAEVGDDVRVAGGEIEIQSRVGGDVIVVGGGTVRIFEDAEIDGDLVVNSGEVRVDGEIGGKVIANGGRVQLRGSVQDGLIVRAGILEVGGEINGFSQLVAEEIVVASDLQIGPLEYWTKNGQIDFGSANAVYKEELGESFRQWEERDGGFAFAFFGFTFLSGLLMIAVLQYFSNFFRRTSEVVDLNIWKSFGLGVLYFVLLPVLTLLLAITLIGLPLAAVSLFAYVFSFVFALPISSLVLTGYLERRRSSRWGRWKFFGVSALLYLVLKIILLIPLIGFLVLAVLVLISFGALISQKFEVAREINKNEIIL